MAIENFFVPKELHAKAWERLAKDKANPKQAPLLDGLEDIEKALKEMDLEKLMPDKPKESKDGKDTKKFRELQEVRKKAIDESRNKIRVPKQVCVIVKEVVPKWLKFAEGAKPGELRDAIGVAKKMTGVLNELLVDLDRVPTRVGLEFDMLGMDLEKEGTAERRAGSESSKKAKEILWLQWKKARAALAAEYSQYLKDVGAQKKESDDQEAELKAAEKALKDAEKEAKLLPSFKANVDLRNAKQKKEELSRKPKIQVKPFVPEREFRGLAYLTKTSAAVYLVKGRPPGNADKTLLDALEGQGNPEKLTVFGSFEDGKVVLAGRGLSSKQARIAKGLKLNGFKDTDKILTRDRL